MSATFGCHPYWTCLCSRLACCWLSGRGLQRRARRAPAANRAARRSRAPAKRGGTTGRHRVFVELNFKRVRLVLGYTSKPSSGAASSGAARHTNRQPTPKTIAPTAGRLSRHPSGIERAMLTAKAPRSFASCASAATAVAPATSGGSDDLGAARSLGGIGLCRGSSPATGAAMSRRAEADSVRSMSVIPDSSNSSRLGCCKNILGQQDLEDAFCVAPTYGWGRVWPNSSVTQRHHVGAGASS